MIEFECPSCAHPIKVAPELAGRKGKCSKCGSRMIIPGDIGPVRGPADDEFFNSLATEVSEAPLTMPVTEPPPLFKGPIWSAAKRGRKAEQAEKRPFSGLRALASFQYALGVGSFLLSLGAFVLGIFLATSPTSKAEQLNAEAMFGYAVSLFGTSFVCLITAECIRLALAIEEHLRTLREKAEDRKESA